jgi:hypothetical protein
MQDLPIRVAIMSRRIVVAGATLAAVMAVSETAFAQTASVWTGNCPYWIDSKTGKRVRTGPVGWNPGNLAGTIPPNLDANHVSFGGHDFVKLPDGSWIDAANGSPVQTGPLGWNPGNLAGTIPPNPDENHVSFGGRSFVRVPCPPADQPASVQALPVLPFGLSIGIGRRDHGDDPYRK